MHDAYEDERAGFVIPCIGRNRSAVVAAASSEEEGVATCLKRYIITSIERAITSLLSSDPPKEGDFISSGWLAAVLSRLNKTHPISQVYNHVGILLAISFNIAALKMPIRVQEEAQKGECKKRASEL